jgi:hypothetical protein
MSAQSIQAKLDKAHKKIATKLGYPYNVYRPLNDIDPLNDRNHLQQVKATFTLSDAYTTTISWEVPIWTVYTDILQLEQGDILDNGQHTYIIISRLPHLPVLAVQADDRIDIHSVGYSNDGSGFSPAQDTYVAKGLPCYISTDSYGVGVGNPGSGINSTNFRSLTVITYLRDQQNLMTRSISARDSFIGDITKYDFSSIGSAVKFTAKESQGT